MLEYWASTLLAYDESLPKGTTRIRQLESSNLGDRSYIKRIYFWYIYKVGLQPSKSGLLGRLLETFLKAFPLKIAICSLDTDLSGITKGSFTILLEYNTTKTCILAARWDMSMISIAYLLALTVQMHF